jgi:transcriptional regulator of acetoin/glycerol metabolism/DNA-binding CsgD family transcriptional regulator
MQKQTPQPELPAADLRPVFERIEALGDSGVVAAVREEIVTSWQRCAAAGLRTDQFDVAYDPDIDARGRLVWAAESVIERVGADLDGTRIGLVLADHEGRVLSRSAGDRDTLTLLDDIQLAPGFLYAENGVGTNAIGTAIEHRGPTWVAGQDHFADALTCMACAAITVTDPATGRVLGAVDVTCAAEDANPLMLPLVKRAAWEIEQRLLEESSVDERLLQEHFFKARRSSRSPMVAINARTMLVNAAAARVFEPADRELLWEAVVGALSSGQHESTVTWDDDPSVVMRCEPLLDGSRVVGAVVRLEGSAGETSAAPPRLGGRGAATLGWASLTGTELAVADRVAEGLTNREVGAQLYLSPHTVDFHLRQIFRKLSVRSRVELTRLMLGQQSQA